ncbi:MAG: OsmC family protein [Rhizobiales bacterium]|nr:OsmC family protein [Hyphomicrobiales bacterium]
MGSPSRIFAPAQGISAFSLEINDPTPRIHMNVSCRNEAVRLILEDEARIRLEPVGEDFEIISEGASLSPYHLLGASLASCTALMIASWGESAAIPIEALTIVVSWQMTEDGPKGVAQLEMELRWPGLPSGRLSAVNRLVDLCPIPATLQQGAEISRRIVS